MILQYCNFVSKCYIYNVLDKKRLRNHYHKNKHSEKSMRLKAEHDKARDQLSVDCEVKPGASGETPRTNPGDTSSSDNDETTYFIPLKNFSDAIVENLNKA